jgi:cysteine desulfurase/selenocysteine lyase
VAADGTTQGGSKLALDLPSIRADFPILSRILPSGRQLVYLDNAATTQKPKAVIQAMTHYYENINSNVHRAVHTLAGEATAAYENARQDIADWFHVDRDQVIYTSGTTEAINLVVHSWGRANLEKGDVVLVTEMEHHSDIVPWQLIAKERGIEIRFISVDPDTYRLNMDEFEASIDEARFVGCVHTSNVLGTRIRVEEIIEMAHSRGNHGKGARVLIDCAQASPHERLNLTELNADFVAISGHKMCGPTGIGGLIVRPEMLDEMQPFMAGGDMIKEVFLDHSTFQTGPYRFEAGTPKIAEAIGWGAAINYLAQFDMEEVHQHIHDLAVHTATEISKISGIKVYGDHTDPTCSGVVSFLHETIHAEDLSHFLDLGGFAVRTGHHCAQPLMRRLGITATNRASFYLYNTLEEADAFITHLEKVVGRLTR